MDVTTPSFPEVDFPILVNPLSKFGGGGGGVRYFESCNDDNDKGNETLFDVTWQCGSHYDAI